MTAVEEMPDVLLDISTEVTCRISNHPDHVECGSRATHLIIIFDTACQTDLDAPVCPLHARIAIEAAMTGGWCECGGHQGHVSINIRLIRL